MTEIMNCVYCNSDQSSVFREIADIVKCESCGLIYLRTRPTKEAMYDIYQQYANDTSHMKPPENEEGAKNNGLRREYFVNEIAGFLQEKIGTWLDIGCGWGALLNYVRELGFMPKGIEMTRNCLDFAAMRLYLPVSNSQFTDSAIENSSCKVISMVHVLEHIPNPKETVAKIFQTLVPGGYFCGIVPNIESFCSTILKNDWVWLDPTHHYVHYSAFSLSQKLEEAGFIIERIYTSIGDYNFDEFINLVRNEFSSLNENELLKKAGELELAGKGEEIRFFARKPF